MSDIKKRGRPLSEEKRVRINALLPREKKEWLKRRGITKTIEALIDQEMEAENIERKAKEYWQSSPKDSRWLNGS